MISTGNIIVIGIVFFISGAGAHYYDKQNNTHHLVNAFLWLSWISAATFTIHIFSLINTGKAQDAIALSPLGMMIAALIASASVMKNIAETKKNESEKNKKEASKFHLDKCTDGLKTFYELLEDGNNTREVWIEASRIITIVLKLSEKITEPHHQDFFELEKSKYRHKLYSMYQNIFKDNEIKGHLFFSGEKDWNTTYYTLEELFQIPHYDLEYIEPNSLIAVLSFLNFDSDYEDPVDKVIDYATFDTSKWNDEAQKYAAKYINFYKEMRGK